MNQADQHQRFEQWTTEHRRILHHVVNAFAEPSDRADLMQEVLLAIWKAIPAFRGDSQPTTFLFRVSHNRAITWRRQRGNYARLVSNAALEPPPSPRPSSGDPVREQQLEQLYTLIRQFPPLDRSLLLLSLDEVSYREMAEVHGIDENLVGVRLARARAKLIHQMKGQS